MASKKTAKMPAQYTDLQQQTKGDKGHCAVIALAAITHLPAWQIQSVLAACGRKYREGTYKRHQQQALEQLGYQVTKLDRAWLHNNIIIQHYPGRAKALRNVTTHHPRRYPKVWAEQPDMLMFSAGHVSAFVDGKVVDWTIKRSKQVYEVWVLKKTGE